MSGTAGRRLAWVGMAVVLAVALFVGATGDRGPRTFEERVRAVASEVRCPTCRGLSAAESDATAAEAIRTEIARRLRAGETPAEVRAYLASRYGDDILLRPEAGGLTGLVWALPVAALVVSGAGVGVAFVRWRRGRPSGAPSDDDRRLVEGAL